MTAAMAGGRSGGGAGFDYIGGLGGGGTFEVIGPRVVRADGQRSVVPELSDTKTPRPNRYLVMDYANPATGKDAEFESAMNQRVTDVLSLPGWMAAQRYRQVSNGRGGRPNKPQFLTMWEAEGRDVNALQASLNEAIKAGKVKQAPIDEPTWEFTFWTPISPYITKEDFIR